MAENIEPSPAKRPRKPNFTPAECAVIFEEAEENLSIIKSKFSSTLSNKNKSRVWEEITTKLNALGVCKRSVVESSIVPDPLSMPVALPDTQLNSSSSSAESLPVSLPSKTSAKLPEQPKKTPRKKVTMDEINELHFAVLQKEKMKLALEIENILLKKREILLRIQELESRSNLFS